MIEGYEYFGSTPSAGLYENVLWGPDHDVIMKAVESYMSKVHVQLKNREKLSETAKKAKAELCKPHADRSLGDEDPEPGLMKVQVFECNVQVFSLSRLLTLFRVPNIKKCVEMGNVLERTSWNNDK